MTSLNRPSLKKNIALKIDLPKRKVVSQTPYIFQGLLTHFCHGSSKMLLLGNGRTDEAVPHWHKLGPVGSDRLTQRWKYGFVWAPFFITTSAMHASKWVNFSSACVGGILGNFALSSHKVQLDLHLAIAP